MNYLNARPSSPLLLQSCWAESASAQLALWVLPAVKLKTSQKDGGGSARVRAGSRVGREALFNNYRLRAVVRQVGIITGRCFHVEIGRETAAALEKQLFLRRVS